MHPIRETLMQRIQEAEKTLYEARRRPEYVAAAAFAGAKRASTLKKRRLSPGTN